MKLDLKRLSHRIEIDAGLANSVRIRSRVRHGLVDAAGWCASLISRQPLATAMFGSLLKFNDFTGLDSQNPKDERIAHGTCCRWMWLNRHVADARPRPPPKSDHGNVAVRRRQHRVRTIATIARGAIDFGTALTGLNVVIGQIERFGCTG